MDSDAIAEFDRKWLTLAADDRRVFIAVHELTTPGQPCSTSDIRDALQDAEFSARVDAEVDRLNRAVEARILGAEVPDDA